MTWLPPYGGGPTIRRQHNARMAFLVDILFWCPSCWRFVGRGLVAVCCALLLLSLRLVVRIERSELRSGLDLDVSKILDLLPVPSTPEGFALATFGLLVGVVLAWAGRWAQRVG